MPILSLLIALLLPFILMLILGPSFIRLLQKWQIGQVIRKVGPEAHYSKKGTPTMGGLLIITAITLSLLLTTGWKSPLIWASLAVLWLFAAVGFIDDYQKLILKDSKGLSSRWKYCFQSVLSIGAALWLCHSFSEQGLPYVLHLPFWHHTLWIGPIGFVVLSYFVMTGASNAVNLTDGLDGLAIFSIILVSLGLGLIALFKANSPDSFQVALLCASLMGAGLGFLWFNGFPASLFMGDVGSIGLGALLGFIAIQLQAELAFFIMSGIFVVETLSVILQVSSYKLRKKRIFKMAPIHHHFELLGLPEPKVVLRFSLVTFVLVMLALTGVFCG